MPSLDRMAQREPRAAQAPKGIIILLLLTLVLFGASWLAAQQTQIDAGNQIKNLPPPAQITQTTYLSTVFDPARRVAIPEADQPCALGSWAMNADATLLCLCLHEDVASNTFRWRQMKLDILQAQVAVLRPAR